MRPRCEYVFPDDPERVCGARPLKATLDSETGPRCRVHDKMERGEWSQEAKRMAHRNVAKRRAGVDPAPRADIEPGLSFGDLMRIVAPALEAKFPNGSPDWSARLCASGVIIASFPRYLRSSVKDVNALLREVLPERVYSSEHHEADQVYVAMRAEWDRLSGLGWHELQGVVVRRYPAYMIAPWETARAIQAQRPAAIPPTDPRVLRLPHGRVALKGQGSLPVLLEPLRDDEPDDGTIEVDASVSHSGDLRK